jgi:tRNA G46 methylase TrmB
MGDGTLLEILAQRDQNSIYIGIDINLEQCIQARSRISLSNVIITNSSIKDVVPMFLNDSVDEFIAALPDPAFIDQKNEVQWKEFYRSVHCKLKKHGLLQIITEVTDELWQPISDDHYLAWVDWLKSCFISLGFSIAGEQEGAPSHYSSRCIEQFMGDPERIRMITLNLVKI